MTKADYQLVYIDPDELRAWIQAWMDANGENLSAELRHLIFDEMAMALRNCIKEEYVNAHFRIIAYPNVGDEIRMGGYDYRRVRHASLRYYAQHCNVEDYLRQIAIQLSRD
jgi:hypothetical protein